LAPTGAGLVAALKVTGPLMLRRHRGTSPAGFVTCTTADQGSVGQVR